MDISYDYYRIFYYVAKYRNFTQAANILMNSQPNITRTIKTLESVLGCTLFVRSNRGVRLTPEGEKLYAYIRIAVEQIRAGEEALSMDKSLQSGIVSIGATEVALRCFLLPVLNEYHRLHSDVHLRISNLSTPQAISALRNGLVDIAFITTPTEKLKSLEGRAIKTFREVAVCGTAFLSSAGKEAITLSDLTQYPMISLESRTTTYEFYSEWFLQHGLRFSPEIEVTTADQILPMVKNDLGIGFVPEELLAEGENENHVFKLRLKEQVPSRSICYVKRADQPLSLAAKELERMTLDRAEKK